MQFDTGVVGNRCFDRENEHRVATSKTASIYDRRFRSTLDFYAGQARSVDVLYVYSRKSCRFVASEGLDDRARIRCVLVDHLGGHKDDAGSRLPADDKGFLGMNPSCSTHCKVRWEFRKRLRKHDRKVPGRRADTSKLKVEAVCAGGKSYCHSRDDEILAACHRPNESKISYASGGGTELE